MNYIKIYTNCKFTKGYKRALISDLQRETSEIIPLDLYNIAMQFKQKKTIQEVLSNIGNHNKKTLYEYIDFLTKKEYAFICTEKEFDRFIDMDDTFYHPSLLTNCIIELSDNIDINSISLQIENVGVKALSIISYDKINKKKVAEIVNSFNFTRIESIELSFKYSKNTEQWLLNNKDINNSRITAVTVHSSPFDKILEIAKSNQFYISFTKKNIKSFNACGSISKKYFNTNQDKVLESFNHNSCLHKKMAIDKNGNIKNCPAMAESYGNIKDSNLEDILINSKFKKYWHITKNEIEVCKDCEFRYVCTDCRAFIENPNNILSKPLKCGYNPYTNEWNDWRKKTLKNEAINYYKLDNLI